MRLSDRVGRIKPSPTIAAAAKARELKADGIDVIDFTVGEPDFDTPQPIKAATIQALNDGVTKYTAASGTTELRKAVSQKLASENGLAYTPDQIVCSCGAKQAIFNALAALVNPGDQVIIPAPYWVSYPDMALLFDAEPIIIETTDDNGFKPTAKQIGDAITDRTRVLLLNTPSNPTGAVLETDLLHEIAEVVRGRDDLFIISDEIYEHLIYDGLEHVSIATLAKEIKERTILVNGFSKTFAMTGWRLGYAAAPEPIARAMGKVQSQSTTNPTSFVQVGGIEAFDLEPKIINTMVTEFDARRQLIVSLINKIPALSGNLPEGAFYLFANVEGALGKNLDGTVIETSIDLCDSLLSEAHVAAVAGDAFGTPGHIRLSYATSQENIREGIQRISDWCDSLT